MQSQTSGTRRTSRCLLNRKKDQLRKISSKAPHIKGHQTFGPEQGMRADDKVRRHTPCFPAACLSPALSIARKSPTRLCPRYCIEFKIDGDLSLPKISVNELSRRSGISKQLHVSDR